MRLSGRTSTTETSEFIILQSPEIHHGAKHPDSFGNLLLLAGLGSPMPPATRRGNFTKELKALAGTWRTISSETTDIRPPKLT